MTIIYNFFIRTYVALIHLAALFSPKAASWVRGRKDWLHQYKKNVPPKKSTRFWFHCASLGEFEQAKPVMEQIKMQDPRTEIIVTFFSPSGYEQRRNEPLADFVGYLPADTASNASDFISLINPDVVFFIKYEFWYHYITALSGKNIPLYLLSGIFRPQQPFFKWYGVLHRRMLHSFRFFFLQDHQSLELLRKLHLTNATTTGDTRFDRVLRIPTQSNIPEDLERFCDGLKTIVAGSCWEAEEAVLSEIYNHKDFKNYTFILVPHDISRSRDIMRKFQGSCLYSEGITQGARAIIIDQIGWLQGIYRLGWLNIVGGGFSGALHNILEAAVWSRPVCFGPQTRKFPEAAALVKAGGGFYIQNAGALIQLLQSLEQDPSKYKQSGEAAGNFIKNGQGATEKVMAYLATKDV